jgi:hypothetical protein
MAIARRKAGTVVRCPTCAGQVVVPNSEPAEGAPVPPPQPAAPSKPEPARGPALFEHSNFDEVFHNPAAPPAPAPAPAPPPASPFALGAQPPLPEAQFEIEPIPLPLPGNIIQNPLKRPSGLLLTPARIFLLSLIILALLALAFFIGLLVGRGKVPREFEEVQAPVSAHFNTEPLRVTS